jgi:hypothetical protein
MREFLFEQILAQTSRFIPDVQCHLHSALFKPVRAVFANPECGRAGRGLE